MTSLMEKRASIRLVSLALFVGLPALLIVITVLNLLQIADDHYAIAEKELQLAAFERRLNSPAADGKPVDLSAIYVNGSSRTLASAALQQYLVDAITASSGRIIETVSTDQAAAADGADASEIGLRATLDIDNADLLQLLYKVESGLPLLDIETLSMRRLPGGSDGEISGMLRVDMAVRGHREEQGP